MSERTTGATDAQIEAAARREWDWTNNGSFHGWDEQGDTFKRNRIGMISRHIAFIVPPDQRIVLAADVLTSEMRSDIVTVLESAEAWFSEFDYNKDDMTFYENGMAAIARLRAIADGGAK